MSIGPIALAREAQEILARVKARNLPHESRELIAIALEHASVQLKAAAQSIRARLPLPAVAGLPAQAALFFALALATRDPDARKSIDALLHDLPV